MKKIVLGMVVLFVFQVCTSELNEIDGVIGDHIESGLIDESAGGNIISIPSESFLVQYFTKSSSETSISTRVENGIRHDFNKPLKTNVNANELSARWIGDFYFGAGEYVFSVKSDKSITVLIDNEILLNDTENKEKTIYEINQQMDGVHRLVVEYNLEKNTITTDSVENSTINDPVVAVDNGTPTIEVGWISTLDAEDITLSIPAESFLVQYFANSSSETSISTRVENRIRHDFNKPLKTNVTANELGARWTGDFSFGSGKYVFSIKSDKRIKVLIDNEIVLIDSINQKRDNLPGKSENGWCS